MPYKVVTWGTGNVGSYAVRAVLGHPELELVAHIVSSPEKSGRDIGELIGLEQLAGVLATDNVDEALATRPDCVIYTAHSETRMMEAAEDQAKCLRQGINVVSSSLFMLQYPHNPGITFLADPLKAACEEGKSTCFNMVLTRASPTTPCRSFLRDCQNTGAVFACVKLSIMRRMSRSTRFAR